MKLNLNQIKMRILLLFLLMTATRFHLSQLEKANSMNGMATDRFEWLASMPTSSVEEIISGAYSDDDTDSEVITISSSFICENAVMDFDQNSDQIVANSPLSGNPDFTVEYWFKLRIGATSIKKSFKWYNANGTDPFEIVDIGGSLSIIDRYFDGGQNLITPFNINVRDDEWHHIAVVKEGDEISVYLDDLTYTYTTNTFSVFDLPSRIKFGRTSEQTSASLDGQLDEIRIWNYARSLGEINDDKNQELLGEEGGLQLYYNFGQGVPNEDNTCMNKVFDKSGNGFDGSLVSFSKNGNQSNIVTSNLNINTFDNYCEDYCSDHCEIGGCDPTCIYDCTVDCFTETINLSTGIDHSTGIPIDEGGFDAGWVLIDAPDSSLQTPRPAFVLTPNSSWSQLAGARYISAYPDETNNSSNIVNGSPYVFEKCFCVCQEETEVSISLNAYVDNNLDVDLFDNDGVFISNLLSITDNTSDAFQFPPVNAASLQNLTPNIYCLRASLKNDENATMGMSIDANITGSGLIKN